MKQVIAVAATAYALYTAVMCPCEEYLSCHKKPYILALVAAGSAAL